MTSAVLTIADLRAAGRVPTLPFRLILADGETLEMESLLRLLPGKRLVGVARWRGMLVLAKLFLAPAAHRHGERERAGIAALQAAGVRTPALLYAGALPEAGFVVLTSFLDGARSVAAQWAEVSGETARLSALRPAFERLGQLHARGLVHADLHLDNFLLHAGECWLIDGDGIVADDATMENLALLLAQLPPLWDAHRAALLHAYAAGGASLPDPQALTRTVNRLRQWRLQRFLKKTLRDCTQFAVAANARCFSVVLRAELATWQAALKNADTLIAAGQRFKDGGAATVAVVTVDGRPLVFKRYNLKHWRHALSRAWRPSRAWHSWQEAHRLEFYGIATPKPLAMMEERMGPLRGRAFLLTEYCPGENLLTVLDADRVPEGQIAEAICRLFAQLHAQRITHGDLKANNLLWYGDEVQVIDLDAMQQHRSAAGYARAWRRDRARFLRNWPAGSALHAWLDAKLPPA